MQCFISHFLRADIVYYINIWFTQEGQMLQNVDGTIHLEEWAVTHWIARFQTPVPLELEHLIILRTTTEKSANKRWTQQFCEAHGLLLLSKILGITCVPLMPQSARAAMAALCTIPQVEETQTRREWEVGNKVQVHFSRFGWLDAEVTEIIEDADGEWLTCRTRTGYKKECSRFDHKIIRPLPLVGQEESGISEETLSFYVKDLTILPRIQLEIIRTFQNMLRLKGTKDYV